MLCAPLATRKGVLGVLKVAACYPGSFNGYEADLVQRFTPLAAVAIQNSQRTHTLEAKMLEAEKKHAVANLLRGVSHDVNNALGCDLPLVQQILVDHPVERVAKGDALARIFNRSNNQSRLAAESSAECSLWREMRVKAMVRPICAAPWTARSRSLEMASNGKESGWTFNLMRCHSEYPSGTGRPRTAVAEFRDECQGACRAAACFR